MPIQYKVDYHSHTPLCKHAVGEVEAYVDQAARLGINELGISDHTPLPRNFDIASRMDYSQYADYVELVCRAQAYGASKNVKVRFALEMDFVKNRMHEVADFMRNEPFDYLLCSCHYVKDFAYDNPEYISLWDTNGMPDFVWKSYAESVLEMVEIGGFEVIGHLDLPKKFGYKPSEPVLKEIDILFQKMFQIAAEKKIAMEINTSGVRKGCEAFYPSEKYVKMAFDAGCPITFGSDAHTPLEVGFMIEDAMRLAYKVGYRSFATFDNRKLIMRPLLENIQ